jgi:hypothetical protein
MRFATICLLLSCAAPFAPLSAQSAPDTDEPLARQLHAVRSATARYQDPGEAEREGYRRARFGVDLPLMGEHWVNRDLLDQPVDLLRPPVLQYVQVGERRVLVGVAYGAWQRPGQAPPEGFIGTDDAWHSHDMPDLIRQVTRHQPWYIRAGADAGLAAGRFSGPGGRSELAMLHLWLWSPNPDGLFANYNPALPYLRAGLPPQWAAAGGYAAARGMELLLPDACDTLTDRMGRLLAGDDARERGWRAACDRAATRVRLVRRQDPTADALNASSAAAWQEFAGTVAAGLSEAEQQELGRLREGAMEDGGHGHH